MNKAALISFVRTALLKREAVGDDQKKLHYQRVAQAVGYAFDTILSQIKLTPEGKSQIESFYVKHYYNQPVSESNGLRYFGVSDDVAPVGNGVWYVQPTGGGISLPYSQRPNISVIRSLPVGGVMNQTFWRFGNIATKKQIILENIGDSPSADIRKVDYGIVRAFSSYSDDEQVVIPDGRSDLLIQLASTWLQATPTDNANNNI